MANHTQFQLVANAITPLPTILESIQLHASIPYSNLSNDPSMHSCSDTFSNAIVLFRGEVARNAHETSDFLLSNVLSSLLKDTISNDAKKLMIDRFFYAPDPDRPSMLGNKARKAANLRHAMEQLQQRLDASQQAIQEIGLDPIDIHDRFDVIVEGIRTVHAFYEQICQTLENLRLQLDTGNISIEDIQAEARWLATLSLDLKAFSNND
ncbi:hypothetical protein QCA50_013537 [Cerrena zonata]|uniref:Uncharacterized protein n=1 Tax=Cerrena zonata TaxID=2478898 RepID=A0AAW0G2J0_9APHY